MRGGDRSTNHLIMPVLLAFHAQGGLDVLNTMLRTFSKTVNKEPHAIPEEPKSKVASFGLRKILDLYGCFVNGKIISDSSVQFTLVPRSAERRTDLLIAQQITLELRAAILPAVLEIWTSPLIERTSASILHGVIDIVKSVCAAEYEPAPEEVVVCVELLLVIWTRTNFPTASVVRCLQAAQASFQLGRCPCQSQPYY